MNIIENADMSKYCTYKAGGRAKYLISVENIDELRSVLRRAEEEGLDFYILGRGSNVLVRDGGYDGIIIRLVGEFSLIENTGDVITAGAAATNVEVSGLARDRGLSGIEFLHGIPGSLGGAVFMNAGAYGNEIFDCIEEVTFLDEDYKVDTKICKDIRFGYRHTEFMDDGNIILFVKLRLIPSSEAEIAIKMDALRSKRTSKQPINYPSCGSVFKRPRGGYAAKLIEDAGLKGETIGGAEVSVKHSGFIINKGGATASDIINLIKLVQKRVKEHSGIDLETEVRIIGKDR